MMFDLLGLYFSIFPQNYCFSGKPFFGPRKYVGSRRNLRIPFYRFVGHVRTLSVPARRHEALIGESPETHKKSP